MVAMGPTRKHISQDAILAVYIDFHTDGLRFSNIPVVPHAGTGDTRLPHRDRKRDAVLHGCRRGQTAGSYGLAAGMATGPSLLSGGLIQLVQRRNAAEEVG